MARAKTEPQPSVSLHLSLQIDRPKKERDKSIELDSMGDRVLASGRQAETSCLM